LRQYGSSGGRRRSVIAAVAVAVAVTASTDQGGSSMSYAIIHQFKGGTKQQYEATLPATVTDS
jgi:hypothetical protein